MILLLIKLIIAHALGDFVFQPKSWVKKKKKKKHRSPYMYAHIAIHLACLLILLSLGTNYWLGILIILFTHYSIDLIKLHFQNKKNERTIFIADQIAHLIVIIAVAYAYEPISINFESIYSLPTLAFILSIIALTSISAIVMKVIMSKWSLDESSDNSLDKAGMYIGILERLFVFGFIVMGQYEAIGLLITAKSVFRFGDLSKARDRKLTEYVLIGTLLSFGLAIMIGHAYLFLQTLQ